jgi:hypothetical protein
VRIIDFYENHGQYADHYCSVVSARGYLQGKDIVPYDARVHEWGTGKTRLETLIALGGKPVLVPDHKVEDGINAGCSSACGSPSMPGLVPTTLLAGTGLCEPLPLPVVIGSAGHEGDRSQAPTLRDLHAQIDRTQSRSSFAPCGASGSGPAGLHQDLMARFLCWHIQEQAQGPQRGNVQITYPWNNFHQTGVLLFRWSRSLK